jgi:hypothetical protein
VNVAPESPTFPEEVVIIRIHIEVAMKVGIVITKTIDQRSIITVVALVKEIGIIEAGTEMTQGIEEEDLEVIINDA